MDADWNAKATVNAIRADVEYGYYRCSGCGSGGIFSTASYCPGCGKRIKDFLSPCRKSVENAGHWYRCEREADHDGNHKCGPFEWEKESQHLME